MTRFFVACLLMAAAGGSVAKGASPIGTLLFPITLPNGFTSGTGQPEPYGFGTNQFVGSGVIAGNRHAVLWSADGSTTDVNPANFFYSLATSGNGTVQVGWAEPNGTLGTGVTHAFLWNGTAGSAQDLNPTDLGGISSSRAIGMDATQQVGYGGGAGTNSQVHALLWNGVASSAVDLNPTNLAGFTASYAHTVAGNQIVGDGKAANSNYHALLWLGSANTAVDLNPSSFVNSFAYGTNGSQQVGWCDNAVGVPGGIGNFERATLWNGSAASAVILDAGTTYSNSYAFGTDGSQQVGYGETTANSFVALEWSGTANSEINLQSSLPNAPVGTWDASFAYSIDGTGNIYGIAESNSNGAYYDYAVEWTAAVPEPASLGLLAMVFGVGLSRPKKRG